MDGTRSHPKDISRRTFQLEALRRVMGKVTRIALERRRYALEELSGWELGFLQVVLNRQVVPSSERVAFSDFYVHVAEQFRKKVPHPSRFSLR